jgi:hypothetical protein
MSAQNCTEIQLPNGCYGLQMPDGKEINSRPGGRVDVPDEYVPLVDGSSAARSGTITTRRGFTLGTREGRWCAPCRFLAQGWSDRCPKCNGPTQAQ